MTPISPYKSLVRHLRHALVLCVTFGSVNADLQFARALETCIRNHARRLAETFPLWGNKCDAVTPKVDFQAKVYEETLTPIFKQYGYPAALWCAMYSLGMVPIVDATQPNNPNFDIWYKQLLCPWNFPTDCGASDSELTDNEAAGQLVCPRWAIGNPALCAPNQHPQYEIWSKNPYQQNDPNRRTMSCALCGRLSRVFPAGAPVGAPDLIEANIGVKYSLANVTEEEKHHFTAWWDMHAFGAWLANLAARRGHKGKLARNNIVANINLFKASNGEEIHGYLWQSLRLLAYDTGTLEGTRDEKPPRAKAVNHAHEVCRPMWDLAPQSMNDCAHAAGHGYFYYFFDIGEAVLACTDPRIVEHAPDPFFSMDFDTKSMGMDGINLMMWRWLCATGVYHAAANTMTVEILYDIAKRGGTAEDFLCKHQNVWGEEDRYFDRCAAGLGVIDAEERLEKVRKGICKLRYGKQPAKWELRQREQFGPTLQLTCNPASPTTGFAVAMMTCPEAFRIHFPCKAGELDYKICTGELFGADVKKDGHIVPFHRLCGGHDVLRRMFECTDPAPHQPGTNKQLYALEWSVDHPGKRKPWNVIDWTMGTNVGVWGGVCTCPDGRVYQVGDEGNMCGSVACDGGKKGACFWGETEGAFRKVICEPPVKRPESAARNTVIEKDKTVGVWGGTCTCPDGQVYLAGDELNFCESIACEGGVAGICNHYVSSWAHVRVKCDTSVVTPSPPPPFLVPPPLPPFPPPIPPHPLAPSPSPSPPPQVPPQPPPSPKQPEPLPALATKGSTLYASSSPRSMSPPPSLTPAPSPSSPSSLSSPLPASTDAAESVSNPPSTEQSSAFVVAVKYTNEAADSTSTLLNDVSRENRIFISICIIAGLLLMTFFICTALVNGQRKQTSFPDPAMDDMIMDDNRELGGFMRTSKPGRLTKTNKVVSRHPRMAVSTEEPADFVDDDQSDPYFARQGGERRRDTAKC